MDIIKFDNLENLFDAIDGEIDHVAASNDAIAEDMYAMQGYGCLIFCEIVGWDSDDNTIYVKFRIDDLSGNTIDEIFCDNSDCFVPIKKYLNDKYVFN